MLKRLHTPSINAKFFFFSLLVHFLFITLLLNLSIEPSSQVNKIILVELRTESPLLSEIEEQTKAKSKDPLPKRETPQEQAQSKGSIFPKTEPRQKEDVQKESFSEAKPERQTSKDSINQEDERTSASNRKSLSLGLAEEGKISLSSTGALKEGSSGWGSEGLKEDDSAVARRTDEFSKAQLSVISRLVREHLEYPYLARRMGWEGEVLLGFRLNPAGEVEEIKVLKSSGFEALDKSALNAVKRASKHFPRPKHIVLIKLPVHFKLEK